MGLPCGIPDLIWEKDLVWPSKESFKRRWLRKDFTQEIRLRGRPRFPRTDRSWFFETWSKAPFMSRKRVDVFLFIFLSILTLLVRSSAVLIADF